MGKIFFTSDTHFCHDRPFIYEPRGFSSVEEMNEEIVKRWNSVVSPEDVVYHLGDVMLNDNEKGLELLNRLNGAIYIITGNHDTKSRLNVYPNVANIIEVGKWADVIKYKGYSFYLSHHPTLTANYDEEAPIKRHLINLFGHTHQQNNFYEDNPFMYHVGLDSHDCYPVEIETVLEDIRKQVDFVKELETILDEL